MKRLGVVLLAVLLLTGCAPQGDRDAAALAERVIIGIGDDITPPYPTPQPAQDLAAWAVADPRLPGDVVADYTVEALSWQGHSGDPEGARIVIRVSVHIPTQSSTTKFGPIQPEGDATRCWQLTIFGFHDYDSLQQTEVDCPAGPAPAQPTLAPESEPTPGAETIYERVIRVLTNSADPEAAVRAEFAAEPYLIEAASENGETAVAIALHYEGGCVVGVLHADGTAEAFGGFDPALLQPGEMGCVPDLYFHPVVTH